MDQFSKVMSFTLTGYFIFVLRLSSTSHLLHHFHISTRQERRLEKDALWCQLFSRLCASNKLYNPRPLPLSRFPPPTSVAVKKLHVLRALGFCSELIFPGFEKLKAHWLQPADFHSAISQQPVAMVTPAQWRADAAAVNYMIQPPSLNTRAFCVAVIISLLDAFCSPLQLPLRFPACPGWRGGNDRSGLFVHMCALAILQMELYLHHRTTFSQITALAFVFVSSPSRRIPTGRQ